MDQSDNDCIQKSTSAATVANTTSLSQSLLTTPTTSLVRQSQVVVIPTTTSVGGKSSALATPAQYVVTQQTTDKGSGVKPHVSSVWTSIPSVMSTVRSPTINSGVASSSHSSDRDLVSHLNSPVLQQQSPAGLPDSGHNYAMTVTTSASPSGRTIHHLSQTSPRQMISQPIPSSGSVSNLQTVSSSVLSATMTQNLSTSSSGTGSTSPFVQSSSLTVASPLSSPKAKKIKLEEKIESNEDLVNLCKIILENKTKQYLRNKENFQEHACELFFLQNGGNMMDYFTWKKRPTPQLITFLKDNSVDSDGDDDKLVHPEVKVPALGCTPVAVSTTLPAAVSQLTQGTSPIPGRPVGGRHGMVFGHHQPTTNQSLQPLVPGGTPILPNSSNSTPIPSSTVSTSQTISRLSSVTSNEETASKITSTPKSPVRIPLTAATPVPGITPRAPTRQHSISAVYDSSIGSQEQIVERAKQEAYVMQRVSQLRKDGLWSSKRLPKVQEPARCKAHWDYLLEEMQWLAADFAQERKWKKAAARKCAKMVVKHLQEQKQKEERAEKEEGQKLRRIASFVAKEVKQFWSNIEKVVEYKQQSILDEKRKKALDLHLNFIVDQTEKYSTWLTRGLSQNINGTANNSCAGSVLSDSVTCTPTAQSKASSPNLTTDHLNSSDDEFSPDSGTDDEETIAKEEEITGSNNEDQNKEIELLKEESELPIEDLLRDLPPEILDKPASLHSSNESDVASDKEKKSIADDDEFKVDVDSTDDEETLDEQESKEKQVDHSDELNELQAEGDLPIEELYKKYAAAYDSDFEMPASESSDETEMSEDNEDDGDASEEDESVEEMDNTDDDDDGEDGLKDVGMEFLINPDEATKSSENSDKRPSKEITDIAAAAESFQPKGYTLSTAQVCTKIPFLLKHQLREYQHIGLDWLVTMNDRKLNGILADEMGLGKTIQTIALLAHLACEKGNWGPHLIVVPTSVMLNWEMEFKKWCPAFKILTYYGSVKERKKKREGWTKPNAFHVCITSYKLVVQDHQSFRRKRWKHLILDEAQNIKNFKSQRWQYLLNFTTARRLLLTGTPLQNSLMELWSLMHFLMPNVFDSHKEFREWFCNPMTGMIEGSHEYNDSLIKRLHKVLRPFLLRRLKCEVEKQLPQKYEHVIMCRLSKRQRFLYDDFMSRTKTKETLASGSFLSVINVLMQLRKVCNHPNMFEERPTISSFEMEGITYTTASAVLRALKYDPLKHINLWTLNLLLTDLELTLTAFAAHRIRKFQSSQKLIEEIDSQPDPPPKCPPGKIRLHIRSTQPGTPSGRSSPHPSNVQQQRAASPALLTSMRTSALSSGLQTQHTSSIRNVISQAAAGISTTPMTLNSSSGPITVQIQQTQQGPRLTLPTGQISQFPGFAQLVQTSSGQHILLTTSAAAAQLLQQAQAQVQQLPSVSSTLCTSSATSQTSTSSVTASATSLGVKMSTAVTSVSSPVVTSSVISSQIVHKVTTVAPSSTSSSLTAVSADMKPVVRITPLSESTVSSLTVDEIVDPVTVTSSDDDSLLKPVIQTVPKKKKHVMDVHTKALFNLDSLNEKRRQIRKERLTMLGKINKRRCEACPLYGSDLIQAVTIRDDNNVVRIKSRNSSSKGMGFIHCLNAHRRDVNTRHYYNYTESLTNLINTPKECFDKNLEIVERFVFCVPEVRAPQIRIHTSHPPPSLLWNEKYRNIQLCKQLSPKTLFLHPVTSRMLTQFPDRRLIQYDCGKLQVLDRLLRELKNGQHRVLIFTQMTRMLDLLEAFLNFHGHIYLRLDGSTRVEQRQMLMERFNADKKIFVFILSTRSGGVGVNLTGADTVIFYDSDWNPTMDAQAQDRCHRIGQTRDVHIYRLISGKTIEENILKKANQKRLLGDIAIEGGNFTTAFFKENALSELFDEREKAAAAIKDDLSTELSNKCTQVQLEQALCQAEEDSDVQAAKTAKAEAAAELAEFDESIPYDGDKQDEPSQVEEELGQLVGQLTAVERYAINFLETTQEPFSTELLKQAEEEIEAQKNNWELGRLQKLKEEEERRTELEEESLPYFTYTREEAENQIYVSTTGNKEAIMPIWCPPTPPQDDNDLFIDYTMAFMYDTSIMSEIDLPPVYVKRESKRQRIDAASLVRRQRPHKEEAIHVPKSMFDRPTAALLKMRREAKLQKIKGIYRPFTIKPPSLMTAKPVTEPPQDGPEWLIHEDWALLQTIQSLQELPLGLTVLSPSQTPNWDLVADVVNAVSRIFRSPKQCKVRYESVTVPREEGRILYEANPKKQKNKTKGIYKTKNNRPMKTSQLFIQDNNNQFSMLYHARFETIKAVTTKRTPTLKPLLVNPTMKNPKHVAILSDSGISYEQPLSPVRVAAIRAERIAQEKQKSQQAAAAAALEQQLSAPRQVSVVQQHSPVTKTTSNVTISLPTVVAKTVATTTLTMPSSTLVASASTQNPGVAIVTNTPINIASPAYTANLNKSLVVTHQTQSTPLTSVRTVVASTTPSIQEQVVHTVRAITNATNALSAGSSSSTPTATVVSVANLTQAQVQAAAQRLSANLNVVTTSAVVCQQAGSTITTTTKNLTPAQLQLFRQTALLRNHRLQEQQLKQQQLKRLQATQVQQQSGTTTVQPARISVAVSSPATTTAAGTVQVQVATAQLAQQRLAQQMVAKQQVLGISGKQTITRTMTESEMAQLIKRQHQLQQQKAAGGTVGPITLSPAHLLAAQAQLQQQLTTASNLQHTQQTPTVATLVKTVSAPSAYTSSGSSVTIPVTAVNVGGVSINVSLPQVKVAGMSTGKVATVSQQQQLRQLQIQQQLLQQRKLQQQQKVVSSLAQVAKIAGKTTIPTQLGAVQIVQGQAGTLTTGNPQVMTASQTLGQSKQSTVMVQQIQQVIKQVQQQQQAQAAQASAGRTYIPVTTISNPTIAVVSSSNIPQVVQQTILAKPVSQTSTMHPVVTTATTQIQARVIPASMTQSAVSKQTIQLLTGVHTIRPQTIMATTATPKVQVTSAASANVTTVKTIPSILQQVAAPTSSSISSLVKPAEQVDELPTVAVADVTSILDAASNVGSNTTMHTSSEVRIIDGTTVAEQTIVDNVESEISIDKDSIDDMMDDSNDADPSKGSTRSSPYPMRVRKGQKN